MSDLNSLIVSARVNNYGWLIRTNRTKRLSSQPFFANVWDNEFDQTAGKSGLCYKVYGDSPEEALQAAITGLAETTERLERIKL